MPKATEELLSTAIASGEIGAISLDTSIFDRYGDDLQNKVLLGLKQFKGTSIAVLFPDIVVSEVKTHITRRASETTAATLRELRSHRKTWRRKETAEELGASAHLTDDPAEFADQEWRLFVDTIEADTLAASQGHSVLP